MKLFLVSITLFCSLSGTFAFFTSSTDNISYFKTQNYSFKIDSNGGIFKNQEVLVVNGQTVLPTPIKNGYSFIGYGNTNDGNVEYTTNIDNIDKINNKKIYAKWETIKYKITYSLNGGTLNDSKISYNVEESFSLSQPTRKGYSFVGWTGSNGSTAQKNVNIPKGTTGNLNYIANWNVINYSISYDLDGGSISSQPSSYNVETDTFSLPQPTKKGYSFVGWTGTDLSSTAKNVTINKGTVGNRSYKAIWSKNYYTVNYYVNGNLWTQRSVEYNGSLPNLNGQDALDGYHKFNGWIGWIDVMPDHNVTLTASITESYCRLITGHGPIGNANAILRVFQNAGWSGSVQEQASYPGNYLVITDYNLTRAQAENQKNYIASHTNYTNYNFPYLYWVAIDCTNGYSGAWTRSVGQSQFN